MKHTFHGCLPEYASVLAIFDGDTPAHIFLQRHHCYGYFSKWAAHGETTPCGLVCIHSCCIKAMRQLSGPYRVWEGGMAWLRESTVHVWKLPWTVTYCHRFYRHHIAPCAGEVYPRLLITANALGCFMLGTAIFYKERVFVSTKILWSLQELCAVCQSWSN